MSWINTYLEKIGCGDVVKMYQNSPDKQPEEFDADKAAADYLQTRFEIFKASDEFKKITKDQQIVALKQYKKKVNEELGLGMSGEEAGTMDPEEFNKKLKDKYASDVEAARNGKSSEWQEKHANTIKELNEFKLLHEKTVNDWTTKYANLENSQKIEQSKLKKGLVFTEIFGKLDWGKDEAHKSNSSIVVTSVMNKNGWDFDENGKLYKGENEIVTTPDGHTVLKTLEDGIKYIATQQKLFPQANAGASDPKAVPKTGDENTDKIIESSTARLQRLQSM